MEVKGRARKKAVEEKGLVMHLPLGECASTFNLGKAVCNHGFFMMAPNQWIPSTKTLQRPLLLADSTTSVLVRISHPRSKHPSLHLLVLGIQFLSPEDQTVLCDQVARMLRISKEDEEQKRKFHEIHSKARKKGFAHLFRSPSLFEDMVKSILLCNCTWKRTLDMAKALCELQMAFKGGLVDESSSSDPKGESMMTRGLKIKNGSHEEATIINNTDDDRQMVTSNPSSFEGRRLYGNFPTSKEIAKLDVELLNKHCNLGYRASYILHLAQEFESGGIKLDEDEDSYDDDDDELYMKLKCLKGFGSFACDNVMMCLGFYKRIPIDTETVKHLQKFHGRKDCSLKNAEKYIKKIYGKFEPFQCLAYWLELLEFYEKKFGKLSKLPCSRYHIVTGSFNTPISPAKINLEDDAEM